MTTEIETTETVPAKVDENKLLRLQLSEAHILEVRLRKELAVTQANAAEEKAMDEQRMLVAELTATYGFNPAVDKIAPDGTIVKGAAK
jgi:hypothetical protein